MHAVASEFAQKVFVGDEEGQGIGRAARGRKRGQKRTQRSGRVRREQQRIDSNARCARDPMRGGSQRVHKPMHDAWTLHTEEPIASAQISVTDIAECSDARIGTIIDALLKQRRHSLLRSSE
jgi:hypothetical protein